jgi:NAD(P)-dependent dehydrogenase (short-subunit alcohol dehydrogenase family)
MENSWPWTADGVGDLAGHTAVVTGASSGIGLETARQLAVHGAQVVLASRHLARGQQAARLIAGVAGEPGGRPCW